MTRLILLQDGQATPFELTKPEVVIGRLPECDVQLPSNMVSRKHARLYRDGEAYLLEDLGSGNGTYVNGQKIKAPRSLRANDRLKFGPVLVRFESEDSVLQDSRITKEGLTRPAPLPVRIQEDEHLPTATIMGSVDSAVGFGLLEVRPQEKLKAVLEISRTLAGTVDIEKLLPKILDSLFAIFPGADRGCILIRDVRTGDMIPRAMKHRREGEDSSVKLSRTILNTVLQGKKAILSADAASDVRFDASESISALTIHSMMCVPMLDLNGEPVGIINIDTQNPLTQFKNDDLDIMVVVASQAALSYESARLMHSYVEKQKQDNEMGIARNVQHALLPEDLPEREGYHFFASYDSAQAVGGDYYDIIPAANGKIWLAFGDVAGKGVPASLVMSRISSVVRSTSEFMTDPAQAVAKINDHMCAKAVEGRFVTFVLIILDTHTHEFSVVNAGHMCPMIRKPDGTVEEPGEELVGMPVGVLEGIEFESFTRTLEPGETVVIYTDGVSEAMNLKNELYGVQRLRDFVSHGSGDPQQLGLAIREDVRKHANGREQNDDITLMVFGRS